MTWQGTLLGALSRPITPARAAAVTRAAARGALAAIARRADLPRAAIQEDFLKVRVAAMRNLARAEASWEGGCMTEAAADLFDRALTGLAIHLDTIAAYRAETGAA